MSASIISFFATIIVTLAITVWAARRGQSKAALYTAGGEISGGQNGLAIAGDFLSATTLLGTTALFFAAGADTALYYICPLVGFALMLLLIAGPLRRLGRFTIGDVMVAKLGDDRMRLFAATSSIAIALIYLIAQMVGAGTLISVLFGLSFTSAVLTTGVLVTIYVAFGGMLAATWVQIVKAVLLVASVAGMSLLVLSHVGGPGALYARVAELHALGGKVFAPGGLHMDMFSALSFAVGQSLGILGLPHLLIRFFTVPDEAAARKSIVVAVWIIGLVFMALFAIIGPGAIALVMGDPAYQTPDGKGIIGGGNMAVLHLATALGGLPFFGIMSGIAFATILAVVAGLTISAASASSHDLVNTLRGKPVSDKTEVLIFRLATVAISMAAVLLAILFQHENVAFLAALVFAIAASTNFPVLILALYWKRTTAAGALAGGFAGLVSSVTLIILSPSVWVKVFGNSAAVFPSDYPTLVTVPLAFAVAIAVSLTTEPKAVPAAG
ncbi:MAG: sodium:solute symporter family transporter [Pseudochelatococcus sp.]|jgi:cation/acetate symporter|uniref:sodium:solute symporter family transporter n=1 Tax=Pseudochelatococcus sp. TaxID=2020869 RepID=UPI003D8A40F8